MPNKIYTAEESAILFQSTGGQAVFTCTSLLTVSGRVSAQYDRGAGSKARWYRWRAQCKYATAAALGTVTEIYVACGYLDGTIVDGGVGQSDAGLATADKRRNLWHLGNIVTDKSADATETFRSSGYVFIPARFFSVVFYNATAVSFSATATDHGIGFEPIPPEIQ